MQFINIGFNNLVSSEKILCVVSPEAAPIKRMIQEAKDNNKLIDASCGRKTRSVLVLESGHVVLCSLQTETIASRFKPENQEEELKNFNG